MTNTGNRTDKRYTLTRHIDAPVETVWSLIADTADWPRWGSFSDEDTSKVGNRSTRGRRLRIGHQRLQLTPSGGPRHRLGYRLSAGRAVAGHSAEITLTPSHDGGTDLAWTMTERPSAWNRWSREARLTAAVAQLAARLASSAEDRPTTRLEWAELDTRVAA